MPSSGNDIKPKCLTFSAANHRQTPPTPPRSRTPVRTKCQPLPPQAPVPRTLTPKPYFQRRRKAAFAPCVVCRSACESPKGCRAKNKQAFHRQQSPPGDQTHRNSVQATGTAAQLSHTVRLDPIGGLSMPQHSRFIYFFLPVLFLLLLFSVCTHAPARCPALSSRPHSACACEPKLAFI